MKHLYPPLSFFPTCQLPAAEDMWHVYNLVREGDQVTATTFRKVAKDTGTGAESERVKMKLTIKVEGVEFDPEGEAGGGVVLVNSDNAAAGRRPAAWQCVTLWNAWP